MHSNHSPQGLTYMYLQYWLRMLHECYLFSCAPRRGKETQICKVLMSFTCTYILGSAIEQSYDLSNLVCTVIVVTYNYCQEGFETNEAGIPTKGADTYV